MKIRKFEQSLNRARFRYIFGLLDYRLQAFDAGVVPSTNGTIFFYSLPRLVTNKFLTGFLALCKGTYRYLKRADSCLVSTACP